MPTGAQEEPTVLRVPETLDLARLCQQLALGEVRVTPDPSSRFKVICQDDSPGERLAVGVSRERDSNPVPPVW